MLTPNAILDDGRTVKTTLKSIVAQTMPTAAVASGRVSEVDVTARVAELADVIEPDFGPDVNLPRLQRLLESRGLPSSRMIAVPLYKELIRRSMVRATQA